MPRAAGSGGRGTPCAPTTAPSQVVRSGPRHAASLAAAAVGTAFSPRTIEQTRAGVAPRATLARRRESAVRAGLEEGLRVAPLQGRPWTLVAAREAVRK